MISADTAKASRNLEVSPHLSQFIGGVPGRRRHLIESRLSTAKAFCKVLVIQSQSNWRKWLVDSHCVTQNTMPKIGDWRIQYMRARDPKLGSTCARVCCPPPKCIASFQHSMSLVPICCRLLYVNCALLLPLLFTTSITSSPVQGPQPATQSPSVRDATSDARLCPPLPVADVLLRNAANPRCSSPDQESSKATGGAEQCPFVGSAYAVADRCDVEDRRNVPSNLEPGPYQASSPPGAAVLPDGFQISAASGVLCTRL